MDRIDLAYPTILNRQFHRSVKCIFLHTFAHPDDASHYNDDQRRNLCEHEDILYPRRESDVVSVYERQETWKNETC